MRLYVYSELNLVFNIGNRYVRLFIKKLVMKLLLGFIKI